MTTSDIGFDELTSYLSQSGWQRSLTGALAEVWHPVHDVETTVLVPKVSAAPDFGKAVKMLTMELSRRENRSQDEITMEISRQFIDVTELRAEDDDITEGTISLASGIGLFNSAHRLMVSAAAATIHRQGYYGTSLPRAAHKHARRLRLGQTRPGSYIVPVISSARFGRLVSEGIEEPRLEVEADESYFERRMLTTLSHALETLAELTITRDRAPTRDEMRSAVDEGVSSELCAAVLDVVGKGGGGVAVFDVNFNWALTSPAPSWVTDRVSFHNEAAELIEHVEFALKEARTPAERILYGIIRRLSLKKHETIGRVAMETVIDGKSRIVNFDLDLQTYRKASIYHGERRPVVVRGILDATPGRSATMKVRAFDADRSIAFIDDVAT